MAKPKTKTATESNNDYKRRNYDTLLLQMPKGAKDQIKEIASAAGVSVSRYILEAVEEKCGLPLTLDNALPWIAEKKN